MTKSIGVEMALLWTISPSIRSIAAPYIHYITYSLRLLNTTQHNTTQVYIIYIYVLNYLCDTNCPNLHRPASLDDIYWRVWDWTSPQMLKHVSSLQSSEFRIFQTWKPKLEQVEDAETTLHYTTLHQSLSLPTWILVVPHKWSLSSFKMRSWCSFGEVLKNML